MIELVRHIEILLLENDCVVVPGFGGFITHYTPAIWNEEENVFLPPVRTIGFNPQLKMNDGILVQSYMEAYNTNFPDATKILQKGIDKLIDTLYKEGKVELANIGQLSLSIHNTYVFAPYDDKVISPFLYGLDSFELRELKGLQQLPVEKTIFAPAPAKVPAAPKKVYELRVNRAVVRNAVAAVAAVLLFFYMSTPIENTYVERVNYAQLLPEDLFGKIEQRSLLTTSIGIGITEVKHEKVIDAIVEAETMVAEIPSEEEKRMPEVKTQVVAIADAKPEVVHTTTPKERAVVMSPTVNEARVNESRSATTTPVVSKAEKVEMPVVVKEVKVSKPIVQEGHAVKETPAAGTASSRYYIITGSMSSEIDAWTAVYDLIDLGYSSASLLKGERIRISAGSFSTRAEADRLLTQLRKNSAYQGAWVLIE